ncbi:MAG: hypothetical protein CMC77_00680 [Flavobacteriaceae bacterium]|nr:hypothetical protein [Flavobacteriaceae bacterium]
MMFPSKHSLNIPTADSIDIVNQNHILINVSSYFLNTLSIFYKHISNFDIIWFNFKKQLIQAIIMKKITLSLIAFSFISNAFAQILDQSANWPNSDWVLTGTYNEQTGLVSNPTEEGFTFLWDDDAAGNASTSDDLQLTSPVIDLTSAAEGGENFIYIFGEYIYRVYSSDYLAIETFDADSESWNVLEIFEANSDNEDYKSCSLSSEYETPQIDISDFTTTQLAGFKYRISYDDALSPGGWEWGFCFSSPTIRSSSPPACLDPSQLTASNITATKADLSWTENGTALVWDIEFGPSGFTPSGDPTASEISNPYVADELESETPYDFYVRANCGAEDGVSSWVGPYTFTTLCAIVVAPYYEGFESFTTSASPFESGNCWTATGGAYFWECAPGYDTGSGNTGPSPNINSGNYFYTEASSGSSGDIAELVSPEIDLSAMTNPGLSFDYHMYGSVIGTLDVLINGVDNVWTLSGQQQDSETTPWEPVLLSLSDYVGQIITVTFRATSAGTFQGDLAIDNVIFEELPECPSPTSLSVQSVTATSAELNWTENGLATLWDIEIVNQDTGDSELVYGVNKPYTAVGLIPETNYSYTVSSQCDNDEISDSSEPFNFTTEESCPTPTSLFVQSITDTSAELNWTENGLATLWDIEIINQSSGDSELISGVNNPYTADGLLQNTDYSFVVISQCDNDEISDASEQYYFTTDESCPTPTSLFVQSITATSAELNWTENGIATLWNVEIVNVSSGASATGTPTSIGVTNPYLAEGLIGDTLYEFYVQSNCGEEDGLSEWAGPYIFITPYIAVDPTCSNGIFVDSGGANLTYSDDEDIIYTICPDNPGEIVTVYFTSFSLENDGDGCFDGLTIYDAPDDEIEDYMILPPGGDTQWCWDRDDESDSAGSGDLQGMTITSSHETGCLTFHFTSDGSVQRDGWEAIITCNTLSNSSHEYETLFTYNPNPVKDHLIINAQTNVDKVTVLNMLGQVVLRQTPDSLNCTVDMAEMKTGVYFVQVSVGNVTETVRVLKQ